MRCYTTWLTSSGMLKLLFSKVSICFLLPWDQRSWHTSSYITSPDPTPPQFTFTVLFAFVTRDQRSWHTSSNITSPDPTPYLFTFTVLFAFITRVRRSWHTSPNFTSPDPTPPYLTLRFYIFVIYFSFKKTGSAIPTLNSQSK